MKLTLSYFNFNLMNILFMICTHRTRWRMLVVLQWVKEFIHCLKESCNVRAYLENPG